MTAIDMRNWESRPLQVYRQDKGNHGITSYRLERFADGITD